MNKRKLSFETLQVHAGQAQTLQQEQGQFQFIKHHFMFLKMELMQQIYSSQKKKEISM